MMLPEKGSLRREHLFRLVEQYGEGSWSKLVPHFAGRIGKQLRERWNHELRPDIQKGAWSAEEEEVLVQQHRVHRNAWADIAKARARAHFRRHRFPCRMSTPCLIHHVPAGAHARACMRAQPPEGFKRWRRVSPSFCLASHVRARACQGLAAAFATCPGRSRILLCWTPCQGMHASAAARGFHAVVPQSPPGSVLSGERRARWQGVAALLGGAGADALNTPRALRADAAGARMQHGGEPLERDAGREGYLLGGAGC